MRASQNGFTMIEVLVALLILSVGLLGIAGMQTLSVQMNVSARQSSQATYLAYYIIDRMRANRQAALGGAYDYDSDGCQKTPGTNNVAEKDLTTWLNMLCGMTTDGNEAPPMLPQDSTKGTGAVVAVNDGVATVTVKWYDERWAQTGDDPVRTVTIQAAL